MPYQLPLFLSRSGFHGPVRQTGQGASRASDLCLLAGPWRLPTPLRRARELPRKHRSSRGTAVPKRGWAVPLNVIRKGLRNYIFLFRKRQQRRLDVRSLLAVVFLAHVCQAGVYASWSSMSRAPLSKQFKPLCFSQSPFFF